MVRLPRLMISAPGSGHGKTTVATGLMAALRAEGLAVGLDRSTRFAAAVRIADPVSNAELYWCGRVTLVADPSEGWEDGAELLHEIRIRPLVEIELLRRDVRVERVDPDAERQAESTPRSRPPVPA